MLVINLDPRPMMNKLRQFGRPRSFFRIFDKMKLKLCYSIKLISSSPKIFYFRWCLHILLNSLRTMTSTFRYRWNPAKENRSLYQIGKASGQIGKGTLSMRTNRMEIERKHTNHIYNSQILLSFFIFISSLSKCSLSLVSSFTSIKLLLSSLYFLNSFLNSNSIGDSSMQFYHIFGINF
jgi:hypothetical protein